MATKSFEGLSLIVSCKICISARSPSQYSCVAKVTIKKNLKTIDHARKLKSVKSRPSHIQIALKSLVIIAHHAKTGRKSSKKVAASESIVYYGDYNNFYLL